MEPIQNEKGEWVIPASRRPDGTWRKEVVVRAGYVPQEEVKSYETTAQKMKKKGIPGLPPQLQKATPNNTKNGTGNKTSAQQKPKTPVPQLTSHTPISVVESTANKSNPPLETAMNNLSIQESEVQQDPAKKLKALKKKLREIEEIEKKSLADLTPEQTEKLRRKGSIEDEIKSLEASSL